MYNQYLFIISISGLSDENDGVREIALRAGQVFVYKLGDRHIILLLETT